MIKQFQKLNLKVFPSRGYEVTPIEFKDVVPFAVKRTYYLTNFETGSKTGEHCHYIEEEVFIVVHGSVIAVIDRGQGREEVRLTGPGEAIYVPELVWHGLKDASPDCVIAALSSTDYNPTRQDYLENYEEYLKIKDQYLK